MQTITVELGTLKVASGKSEFYFKPSATAMGIVEASQRSPIPRLLGRLLEDGMVNPDDMVNVVRGTMQIFMKNHTVAEWLDGRAMGKKPGSHEWLWKGRWKDDDDDSDE